MVLIRGRVENPMYTVWSFAPIRVAQHHNLTGATHDRADTIRMV